MFDHDLLRLKQAQDLEERHGLVLAGDYYVAALIYHHASDADHHREKAYELAVKAYERRPEIHVYKTLVAMAYDRLLRSHACSQYFGTQFVMVDGSRPQLEPVQQEASDEDRLYFEVPPLAEQRKVIENVR